MIYVTGDLHGDLKDFKKRKLHKASSVRLRLFF